MLLGGAVILISLVIPIIWITITNLKFKKYYLNVFKEKKVELFKLSNSVFLDIKVFQNIDGSISVEKNDKIYKLSLSDEVPLKIKFKVPKGKSYYLIISKTISNQIAQFIFEKIEDI
jgi:hypothetical protein